MWWPTFFFFLCIWTWLVQLDSDISICLYLDWLWKLAAAAQRFLSNQAAGSVPRQMRTIPLAVLRRVAHINYPIDSLSCACFVLKWVVYVSYGRTEKPLEATFCFRGFFVCFFPRVEWHVVALLFTLHILKSFNCFSPYAFHWFNI